MSESDIALRHCRQSKKERKMATEREEILTREMNEALTVILLEVYAGVMKKSDALLLLQAMRATIEPAIKAIDDTIAKVKN